MIGYLLTAVFSAAAFGPFICLVLLKRHCRIGGALSPLGAPAIYFGCLCWILILAGCSALVESFRPWIGLPILAGLCLGVVWQRRQTPPETVGATASSAAVFLFFSLVGWVSLSGGYFDKLFQIPFAQSTLRKTGVDMGDPAALARALRDKDVWVRWGAALALGRLGAGALPALGALAEATEDGDARVRHYAWNSINNLGPKAAPAAPAIAALLKKGQNDYEVRRFFEAVGPEAKGAVPALLASAEDPAPRVRAQALEALGCVGPGAKEAALPVLARIHRKETDSAVKRALSQIHSKLGITFAEWQQAISAPQ